MTYSSIGHHLLGDGRDGPLAGLLRKRLLDAFGVPGGEDFTTIKIELEELKVSAICAKGALIGFDVFLNIVLADVSGEESLAGLGGGYDICLLIKILDVTSLVVTLEEILNTNERYVLKTELLDQVPEPSVISIRRDIAYTEKL